MKKLLSALVLLFAMKSAAQLPIDTLPPALPHDLTLVRSLPEAGIEDPFGLDEADAIVQRAIAAGAFPGCRVLAARDGKIFYDKAFGKLGYEGGAAPVTPGTLYDIASVTKVAATTLAVMKLYEQGRLRLDKTLGEYLPMTRGTDKAPLLIRNLLLHQAGLKAWIPFYKSMYDSTGSRLSDTIFHPVKGGNYSLQVAEGIWMRRDYKDTVWKWILQSPLETHGRYVYSDLDFYFLAAVVEKLSGKSLDRYVQDEFYSPMNLRNIGYNPLGFMKPTAIAPTELDNTFRHQLIRGYVHDQGAALFGGVAGHAGVFATARNLAALFQMLLNEGSYRGKRYLKPETVRLFTAYHSAQSRRGLGFDKPEPSADNGGPAGNYCSGYAFGHQGFTGTCVWADPATGVVFVFLSNRINPSAENTLINRLSIRTELQDALYRALKLTPNNGRALLRSAQVR